MSSGNSICLVNRTDTPLSFVFDGRHYILEPGENWGYQEGHAAFALKQNPVMGSEDFNTTLFESLVGVKGNPEYPCDALSDEVLLAHLESKERLNRKTTPRPMAKETRTLSPGPRGRAGVTGNLGVQLSVGGA